MRPQPFHASTTRQQGFALMEVVIAMFVLAIGILGAGALQTMSMQTTQGAYYRSQAMLIAADMVDRMRANRAAMASYGNIDTDQVEKADPVCINSDAGCSAAALAGDDIQQWAALVQDQKSLPNARGVVTQTAGTKNFQISISWNENEWQQGKRSASAENSKKTYQLNVALDDN